MKFKLTVNFDVIIMLPGANTNETFVGTEEDLIEKGTGALLERKN